METATILVTGASGYVGARLVPRLLALGHRVRAAGRSVAGLSRRPWADDPRVELAAADVLNLPALRRACAGCRAAFYLVHSMDPGQRDFVRADREGATNMARAAAEEGLERIVYLGGLEAGGTSSGHLRSRDEVGRILAAGAVPLTWLRAAMIIGAGSGSFEILRYLVDRLPAMVTPRWVDTESQPIAIRNVLDYLAGCLDVPETAGETFDIGGPEVTTYRRLMDLYAREALLSRRRILPVPVLTPRLSSYWIDLVTPVPASLARPLAEGLGARLVCGETRIRHRIPADLLDCREAIRAAVRSGGRFALLEGAQASAAEYREEGILPGDPPWTGGTVYTDHHRIVLDATPEELWKPLSRIGGRTGWYYADWLWALRGLIDRAAGGIGMRRGSGTRGGLSPGDAVDFWRVAAVEPPFRLRLVAEMKLPGRAVLEFRIRRSAEGASELHQVSRFVPRGLGGLLYWRAVDPLHHFVLSGMLRRIARATGKRIVSGPDHVTDGEGSPPTPRPGRVAA